MNKKFEIAFSPTQSQMDEIEKWLLEEYNKKREGFYCNWKTIQSFYEDKQLAIVLNENKSIGFITWRLTSDKSCRIEIAEIKPSFREKGAGKFLVNEFIKFIMSNGIVVCDLTCSPETSEPFWKNFGFVEFSDPLENLGLRFDDGKRLFMVLTESLMSTKQENANEIIELWNDQAHRTIDNAPTYTWNLEFIAGARKLTKPIIQPAHRDWRIRWQIEGKIIIDDRVKKIEPEIYFGTFVIIEELKL